MGPASSSATERPRSVSTLTAVPPPAPEPTTATSNTCGVRVICSISSLRVYLTPRLGRPPAQTCRSTATKLAIPVHGQPHQGPDRHSGGSLGEERFGIVEP